MSNPFRSRTSAKKLDFSNVLHKNQNEETKESKSELKQNNQIFVINSLEKKNQKKLKLNVKGIHFKYLKANLMFAARKKKSLALRMDPVVKQQSVVNKQVHSSFEGAVHSAASLYHNTPLFLCFP